MRPSELHEPAAGGGEAAVPWPQALQPLIDGASGLDELARAAARIPQAAAAIVAGWHGAAAQACDAGRPAAEPAGVAALTAGISHLNDEVTRRVVQAVAAEAGVDLGQACWLAFGSQARGEQTLVTDQDNGLVFAADGEADAQARRPAWQAFGQRVNEALARCGYPLCDGRVMAGQPLCCLSPHEWCRRFAHWLEHGDGNDLFAARIYFDLRPLAGNPALARPLVELLRSPAAAVPRFIKQMADIVLCNHVPLNWLGRVVTAEHEGQPMFDLKMSGTALFVDAGRLWALAHRLAEVGTAPRLHAAARALRVPDREAASWVAGFQTLQRLRLDAQRRRLGEAAALQRAWVRWSDLDPEARRALQQALRAARLVQQRIELDYCR
jgi:CBS domain-containing protein